MNLEEKINKIVDTFKEAEPGSVAHVIIKHDLNCPAISTQNLTDCTCEPEIQKGNHA